MNTYENEINENDNENEINENENENNDICRICLSNENKEDFINPCICNGTSKYVHISCLNTWIINTTNTVAKNKCMECNYNYKYKKTEKYFFFKKINRKTTVLCIIGLYSLVNLFFGILISLLDNKNMINSLDIYNTIIKDQFKELIEKNLKNLILYYISLSNFNTNILLSIIWITSAIININDKRYFIKCYKTYFIIIYSLYHIYLPYVIVHLYYLSYVLYLYIINMYMIYNFMICHNTSLNEITKLIFENYNHNNNEQNDINV